MYDISQIAALLSKKAEIVARTLFPQGQQNGSEWCVGDISGEKGKSLRISLSGNKAGIWTDFASNSKGGDLIDLVQQAKHISKREAVQWAKDFLGIREEPRFEHKAKAFKKPEPPKGLHEPGPQMRKWFQDRGISQHTLAQYRVGEIIHPKFGPVIVFPYYRDGELVFVKYRPLCDKNAMWTSKDSEPCLFGWQVMRENVSTVIVTEGEIDALSYYQAGYLALSVPRGGGTAGKQDGWIEADWEKLSLMRGIYLSLDMDQQGQDAKKYIAQRLGLHRCYCVDLPYKDANEALLHKVDFGKIFDNSNTLDPNTLRKSSEYHDDVMDFFLRGESYAGDKLPWDKTYDDLRLRMGETTVWAGTSGHGKTQMTSHVIADSIVQGNRWCIASMEMKPVKLMARMYRQLSGKNQPEESDIAGILTAIGNLWIYDVQGTADPKDILEVFEYARRRYGVDHFLIDSLAKCGFADDGYNEQKAFVDTISSFARDNDVQMHLICHTRKKEKEDELPNKYDVKGTSGITDMVDNVYIVWRNKGKEDIIAKGEVSNKAEEKKAEPDAILYCCKQREGTGWEGKVGLWYDKASCQYMNAANSRPINYSNRVRVER